MLVDVQVSSINTSFSRSIPGCASLQARRAACTSSRSCSLACTVFFEGEIPFVQLVPQSADLDRNAQHLFPLRQPRAAMAADLKTAAHARLLFPVAHLIDPNAAHLEPSRNLRRTIPAIQRPQHALAQILRIG